MKFRGGEFSTGTTGNFQSELTLRKTSMARTQNLVLTRYNFRYSGLSHCSTFWTLSAPI
jgi:hypothetical protein